MLWKYLEEVEDIERVRKASLKIVLKEDYTNNDTTLKCQFISTDFYQYKIISPKCKKVKTRLF